MQKFWLSSAALAAAAFTFSTPAFAQDFCGGIATGGQWIGEDAAGSDIATASSHSEKLALVLGGAQHVTLFTLSETADVRLEAQSRGAGDPQIDLFNSVGEVILSDDDSGGNGAARGETTLDAGEYCLALRSYDGAPMTAFVRLGLTSHDPLTDGIALPSAANAGDSAEGASGSCDDATPLPGDFADGGLTASRSVNDGAFWAFTLSEPAAVAIRAENQEADPVLTLFDASGEYIADNDDHDGLNSLIEMTDPLAAGDYCLEVSAIEDDDAPIDVSVNPYDPAAEQRALYDQGQAAPPLDGSVPFTPLGLLEKRLTQEVATTVDVTWFTVEIDSPGLLLVEAIAITGESDPWLVAYDDLGRKVGQNDDYGEGYDSLIAARVHNGTYLIGVRQFGEGEPSTVRMAFERFTSAP